MLQHAGFLGYKDFVTRVTIFPNLSYKSGCGLKKTASMLPKSPDELREFLCGQLRRDYLGGGSSLGEIRRAPPIGRDRQKGIELVLCTSKFEILSAPL